MVTVELLCWPETGGPSWRITPPRTDDTTATRRPSRDPAGSTAPLAGPRTDVTAAHGASRLRHEMSPSSPFPDPDVRDRLRSSAGVGGVTSELEARMSVGHEEASPGNSETPGPGLL